MTPQKKLMVGLIAVIAGLMLWPAGVAMAVGGLPDRNPPPVRDSGERDDSGDSTPLGATIELTAWPPGGMSVVQWQDINGNWQDVDGWRGTLDNSGRIRWWVADKDFGSGSFRWMAGEAASEPFNLPAGAGQTVRISIN